MERHLVSKGGYETFKAAFADKNGSTWNAERDAVDFLRDDVVHALAKALKQSEESAAAWFDNARETYRINIEGLAKLIPVSYTHLDVYKRQLLPCLPARLLNTLTPGIQNMKIRELFTKPIDRPINGVIKADQRDAESIWQELDEYVPVFYTHLDVYKRQPLDTSARARRAARRTPGGAGDRRAAAADDVAGLDALPVRACGFQPLEPGDGGQTQPCLLYTSRCV